MKIYEISSQNQGDSTGFITYHFAMKKVIIFFRKNIYLIYKIGVEAMNFRIIFFKRNSIEIMVIRRLTMKFQSFSDDWPICGSFLKSDSGSRTHQA